MFYVYTHSINDEVVYVGKGSSNRCYESNDRNDSWNACFKSAIPKVDIVETFGSENDALEYEKRLIKKLNPKVNIALKQDLVTVTYKIKESQRDFLREEAHKKRTSASNLVRLALTKGGVE